MIGQIENKLIFEIILQKISQMNIKDLEQYTKKQSLFSQNDSEILATFIRYAHMCCDPLNIFKYMEEKSICVFLGNYWINKAETLAKMGDFKNAFLCIQEAESRIGISEEKEINFQKHLIQLKQKAVSFMKRKIVKRSVFDYDLITQDGFDKNPWVNVQKIVKLYDQKYRQSQKEALRQFQIAQQNKPKSWLAPLYEKQQQQISKIEDHMGQNSIHRSLMSLRTPLSKRDPLRLTHALDSIQMIKKKKSTNIKTQKSASSNEDQFSSRKNHTTPVGRELNILSRRVTFNVNDSNVQKNEENMKHNKSEKRGSEYKSSHSNDKRGTILRKSSSFFCSMSSQKQKK